MPQTPPLASRAPWIVTGVAIAAVVVLAAGAGLLLHVFGNSGRSTAQSSTGLAVKDVPKFELGDVPSGFHRDDTVGDGSGSGVTFDYSPGPDSVCRRFHFAHGNPICDEALSLQSAAYAKGDPDDPDTIDITTFTGQGGELDLSSLAEAAAIPGAPPEGEGVPQPEPVRVRGHRATFLDEPDAESLSLTWQERDGVRVAMASYGSSIGKRQLIELADHLEESSTRARLPLVVGSVAFAPVEGYPDTEYVALGHDGGHTCVMLFPLGTCDAVGDKGPISVPKPESPDPNDPSSSEGFVSEAVLGRVRPDVATVRIELDRGDPISVQPFTTDVGRPARFFAAALPENAAPLRAVALDAQGNELGQASADLFPEIQHGYVQIGRGSGDPAGPWRLSGKLDSDGSVCTQFDLQGEVAFPGDELCDVPPDATVPISETAFGDADSGYLVGMTTTDATSVRIDVNGTPYTETSVIGADKRLRAGFYVAPVGQGILTDDEDVAAPLVAVALDAAGNEIGRYDEQAVAGTAERPPPTGPVETFAEGDDAHGHWKVVANPTADGVCLGVGYADPPAGLCLAPTADGGTILGGTNLDPDAAVAVVTPEVAKVRIELTKGAPIEVTPTDGHPPYSTARIAVVPVDNPDRVKRFVALDANGRNIGEFDASSLASILAISGAA